MCEGTGEPRRAMEAEREDGDAARTSTGLDGLEGESGLGGEEIGVVMAAVTGIAPVPRLSVGRWAGDWMPIWWTVGASLQRKRGRDLNKETEKGRR